MAVESLTSHVNTSFLAYVAEPSFQASSVFSVLCVQRGAWEMTSFHVDDEMLPESLVMLCGERGVLGGN